VTHQPLRAIVTLALVLAGLPLAAQVRNGSHTQPPADAAQRAAAAQAQFASALAQALSPDSIAATLRLIKEHASPATTGLTNFDNVNAPCDFLETAPLAGPEQYAGFEAPAPNGGAILNGCANYGVEPHSPPNFLAFNSVSGYYKPAGIPQTPELIYVAQGTSSVSLWVSGGDNPSNPFALVAFGEGGVLGMVNGTTSENWQQIGIAVPGIRAAGLVGSPGNLLVDDIQTQ